MEMATFSARKERMSQLADAGDRRGTLVNAFQRSPADYLAAIQLIVTAANFIIGAMIGAYIEQPILDWFESVAPNYPYPSKVSWTLAIGGSTLVALIFTNVLPKQIGFIRANEIAVNTARAMKLWMKLTWPITSIVRLSSKWFSRVLRIAPDEKHRVTEGDIHSLLAEGVRAGSIDQDERTVMSRALQLSDVPVSEVMVPASDLLWVESDWNDDQLDGFFRAHLRSNYPVRHAGESSPIGVVRVQDWYIHRDLKLVMRQPDWIESEASLLRGIELLRPAESRVLFIKADDEFVGILTLNDALRFLVGPICVT